MTKNLSGKDLIVLNDQYRLSLNEFGDFTNVNKKAPQTQFEALIGIKKNPIITRVISTDYTNYGLYYYCNEQNPYINHDEIFVLIRNQTKAGYLSITKELLRFGYDLKSFNLVEHDLKDCERVSFQFPLTYPKEISDTTNERK